MAGLVQWSCISLYTIVRHLIISKEGLLDLVFCICSDVNSL